MTSLSIFEMEGITKELFKEIFDGYNVNVGCLNDVNLNVSVDNYHDLTENLVNFQYQHDFEHSVKIRDNTVKYPYFHKAEIWILFTNEKDYLFISAEDKSIKFILPELKKIVAKKTNESGELRELVFYQFMIGDLIADIIISDAIEVTGQWFKKLNERERSAFLSGQLLDREGGESDHYTEFKRKAERHSSVTFISKNLGYKITISKSKISSKDQDATPESIIDYFEREIIELS